MKPFGNASYIELHIPNFDVAKNYYGKLGFEIVWERKPEGQKGYLVLKLENNIIAFWCGNKEVYNHPFFKKHPKESPRGYGVEIVLMVADIESYYEKVKDFANVVEELTAQPWGLKDFRVEDPYGFYLRITEQDDITKPSPIP